MYTDAHELIRDLAAGVTTRRSFDDLVADDDAAVDRFVGIVHHGRCPLCQSKNWAVHDDHSVRCDRGCGVVSVYVGTPWRRRSLGIRAILAAAHAIFVDVVTPTSRGFAERLGLRLETAWKLLHEMREALPCFAPAAPGLRQQVLGFCNDDNAADVVVSFGSGRLTFVEPDAPMREGMPDDRVEAERRVGELPLWLGRLRAWLTTMFRGVSRQHLWKYLSEFSARHQRVFDRQWMIERDVLQLS